MSVAIKDSAGDKVVLVGEFLWKDGKRVPGSRGSFSSSCPCAIDFNGNPRLIISTYPPLARTMDEYNYMDEKLYEAARSSELGADVIPSAADGDDDDGLFYLGNTPGDQSNALHVAARYGNHEFIRAILARTNPDELLCKHNSAGETPLHLAAQSGSKETVQAILDAHDDNKVGCWRERDKQGDTPLHIALRYGHEEMALLMLERDLQYLVSLENNVGESLAYLAADNACTEFLHKILDADRNGLCSVHFSGPFGQTTFHPTRKLTGAIMSISIQRRNHLLKVQDIKGKTVLHYAVEEERDSIIEMLLKEDKTLAYLHDQDGLTPLHIAASSGFLGMIRIILELCPQSITIRDKYHGRTALHVVKMDGYSLEKCLNNTRMRELINQVDNDGNTPLHLALMRSDLATADKLLLVDGINWRLTNKQGYTPMDLCISDDQIPLKLKRLVAECRAKEVLKMDVFFHKDVVNTDDVLDHYNWEECLAFKGPKGDSILHTASRDGNLKIINRVHESDSARVSLLSGLNSKGETPLHLAAKHGQLEVVQSILSLTSPSTIVAIENMTALMKNTIDPFGDHVKPWRNKSANGDTPAHKSIRSRHGKVTLLLLQRDPELISILNNAKESLLFLAADNNCYDVIKGILSKDREYDDSITSGRGGQNFLHAAARCPRYNREYYTRLTKKQPHLLQKADDNGKTPLHHAVEEGCFVTTRWMLTQDKSATFVYDNEGFTPLLRAAALGRSLSVRSILDLCPQSAELRDLRCDGTALHLAKMPLLFLRLCMRHKVMRKLVNETDKHGNSALHCAILDGDVDKALVLLETQGINWTIRNKQHKSPMDLCQQQMVSGETKQRPIHIVLKSLATRDGINPRAPRIGSWIKFLLMAYGDLIMTDENLKKLLDNIAVVAALLVTITFAAAFTIPGGYDQNTGEAMLVKKAAVRVFMASDVLGMLMAISILVWYTVGGRRANLRKLGIDIIIMLQISLVATIVAFISGVYAIGCQVKPVIIVPIVIAAFFNLYFLFRPEFFEFYF